MYKIVRTKIFERSYKKLKQSGIKERVMGDIKSVIDVLASGKSLSAKHRDHKLTGHWQSHTHPR